MWFWFHRLSRRLSATAAHDPATKSGRSGDVGEAVEKRVQLAVAEATAHAEEILRRHAEAIESRIHLTMDQGVGDGGGEAIEKRIQLAVAEATAYATTYTEDALHRHAEATESRIQITIDQVAAYTEERLSDIVRDVRDQRRHVPAFLNAAATVPALAFELSSLRKAQEATAAELSAKVQQFGGLIEQVKNDAGSAISAVEASLTTAADQRNEDLVASLRRFEQSVADKEGGYDILRESSKQTVAELEALSGEIASVTAEIARLREAFGEGQTDRGLLWKAAEGATRGIGELWQRLEFVRKEIMYEMRFGERARSEQAQNTSKPKRIVSDEKLKTARIADDIRLNLGSGHIPVPGYLNVDFRDLPGVDIVADVADLPFEPGSVSEITSFHVLEHFSQEHLRRLLPYWRSLLKPNSRFRAVVPDGEAMLAHQAAGTYSFEDFRMVLFGAQEYEGDFHFNMFTPDSLGRALAEAGFGNITFPAKGRKNDICFEFEVVAIAP